jgi:type IV secretion system protein VirB9
MHVGLALAAPALWAETAPSHSRIDARIKEVTYNPSDVVRVIGHFGYSTDIQFADGEEVRSIALGDTLAWDIAPSGNHLFVKPREDHASTNMTVMTDRRVYQFVLDARAHIATGSKSNAVYFLLRFRYPQDVAAAADAELKARIEKANGLMVDSALRKLPETRNWIYYACGDRVLWPAEVFDDGRFTFLRFPAAQNVPAVFEIGPDGEESIVDGAMEGDYYVVRHIARRFVLRMGKAVACVENRAFNVYGAPTPNGTRSWEVQRKVVPVPKSASGITTSGKERP